MLQLEVGATRGGDGEGLGPASMRIDLVDFLGEALPSLGSRWGVGWRERGVGREEGGGTGTVMCDGASGALELMDRASRQVG